MSFRKLSEGQNSVVESRLTAEPAVVDAGPGIETSGVSVLEIHISGGFRKCIFIHREFP